MSSSLPVTERGSSAGATGDECGERRKERCWRYGVIGVEAAGREGARAGI